MSRFAAIVCVAAIAGTAVAAAQAPKSPQKPGKWQVKIETEMPGMPMKMPAITQEICLTEQDLADPQKNVPADQKNKCTVSDYKVTGGTVSWKMDCPKDKMSGAGEMTYTDNSYAGTIKIKMEGQEVTQKHSGKWLGTCSK
jgi:hypothetical protein